MRSSLCEPAAAPLAHVGLEAKNVVATEVPINVRRFMRGIVLFQRQKGIGVGGQSCKYVNQPDDHVSGERSRKNTPNVSGSAGAKRCRQPPERVAAQMGKK